MHHPWNSLSGALVAILLTAGCASGSPGGDKKDGGASCNDNNDCRPGYTCVNHLCVSGNGDGGTDGGGQPAILVEPRTLVFDEAVIGAPQTLTFTITNLGTGTLVITDTRLVEDDAVTEFTFAPPSRTTLGTNESVPVQVTLDPTDSLLDTGTLFIESNDSVSSPVTVTLSSAFIGSPDLKVCVDSGIPAPDECADPMLVDYGEVAYGTVAQADFYLANVGTGNKVITVSDLHVASTSPSHGALFQVELFRQVENPPGSGTFVETPATLPADLAPSLGGAPDPLALYGRLSFTANTDGFLILNGDTLNATTSDTDDPTPRETVIPITGTINGCPPGLIDLNGVDTDGCEYGCAVTNGGVEACDGLDNDCDGTVDGHTQACYDAGDGGCNADGTGCRGICQAGTQLCTAGQWGSCGGQVSAEPEACDGLDNDCNGVVNDGLDEGGNACGPGSSIARPNRPENGTVDTIQGTVTQGDEDWYVITFTDTVNTPNQFDARLTLTSGSGNARMDVRRDNCTTQISCDEGGVSSAITSFTFNAAGEVTSPCTGGPQPCPSSHSMTLYVRVYKLGGPVCETYTLVATNNP